MTNLFSIAGKVAIVTGGSRGIGEMIAQGYVEHGAKVYITARKAEDLDATAKRLSELGECTAIVADLSTVEGISKFASEFSERESKLDILVNNAGATWGAPLDEYPESGWDKTMDLNVKSPFYLLQKLLPALDAAATSEDPARVINISSVNGITASHMNNFAYGASKAALIYLTKHLAADLGPRNINVNGIAPAAFPTKMIAFALKDEATAAKVAAQYPRGRIGNQQDAAGAAIFLCSMASTWITGHTLVLDGGMVAST